MCYFRNNKYSMTFHRITLNWLKMKDYLIFVLRNRTLFYFSNTIHVIHCSKSAHIVRFYIVIQSIPFVPAFRLMYSNNFLCKGLMQEPNYVSKPDISKNNPPPPPTKKLKPI